MRNHQIPSFIFLALCILIFSGCNNATSTKYNVEKTQEHQVFVIKNVNIIPMTKENRILENATVVIENKKIVSINESIPANAKTIDGTGKWLIPGLIDMHVHTNADLNFRENASTQAATFFMDAPKCCY